MATPKTPQFLRQRQMLTVMPLIMLPFVTLIFWSFDGGKASAKETVVVEQKGINTNLPVANLKSDQKSDKMSLYAQATHDSMLHAESNPSTVPTNANSVEQIGEATGSKYGQADIASRGLNSSPVYKKGYKDPNEEKVNAKLQQLYQTLNQNQQAVPANQGSNPYAAYETQQAASQANQNVAQLAKMLQNMKNSKGEGDPEMQQMDGMLDKILDIQNPERVRDRIKEQSIEHKGAVYAVNNSNDNSRVSLIRHSRQNYPDTDKTPSYRNIVPPSSMANSSGRRVYSVSAPVVKKNGFFGLNNGQGDNKIEVNSIQAVIHQGQTLISGSTVKMRLLTDVYLNGQRIPKDNFVYGLASISGERLNISINSIRYQNSLFPVSLMVYDMDGLNGIYIPGAIERDASKDAVAQGINGVNYMSVDPTITTQLATSAVSGAKGLLSKKVRLIKVNVKANYKVLLQDSQQNNL